jgi:GntR family galactonate operon transcriptional repressor
MVPARPFGSGPAVGGGPASQARRTAGYPGRGLHGSLVEDIGRRIVAGWVEPGEPLPAEPRLAADYDVSRTAVREALRVLAAKGLVEARPMRGTRVRARRDWRLLDPDLLRWSIDAADPGPLLRDLLDVRLLLEPAAARLAAERAGPGDHAAVEAAYAALTVSLDDPDAFIEADLLFHRTVIAAAGNPLLGELVAAVEAGLRLARRVQVRVAGDRRPLPEDPLPAHLDVARAIVSGEGRAADAAMRRIVISAARDAEAVLGSGHPAAPVHDLRRAPRSGLAAIER